MHSLSGMGRVWIGGRSARRRESAICAVIGAATALAIFVLAPPAQDVAAHVYRTTLVEHGGVLWDNYWYTGDYPLVGYSILAPVLSAYTGLPGLLVASTAASGCLFALISLKEWGPTATWPARAFAFAAALPLLPGVDAYAVAVPFALGTFLALQSHRRLLALVCASLVLATSPLAFLFLLGVVGAIALAGRCDRRSLLLIGGGLSLLALVEVLALVLVFPTTGVYPFLIWHLLAVGGLAIGGMLAGYRDRATRPIAIMLGGWGLACVASYLVANPVGDNLARMRYAAFPLILLLALHRDRRRLASVLALAALIYAAGPDLLQVTEQADAQSSRAQAWEPALHFLSLHLPVGGRVEVVPTSARWESFYLPSQGIPLARGWFRQTDMARNGLFYHQHLPAADFRRWLANDAVQYVVLTPFTLDDHGARAEAALLRSSRSGLDVVWRSRGFIVYRVHGRADLLAGSIAVRLTRFTHERIAGTTSGAGVDSLKVWFSPYWTSTGAARCVTRARDGMSLIQFDHPGPFSLAISHNPLKIAIRATDPDC